MKPNKIQDEINNEIFMNGRTAERKKVLKIIQDFKEDLEAAGYESSIDMAYYHALCDIEREINRRKE